MSRGLGNIQRAILAAMTKPGQGYPTGWLACQVYGTETPTAAQLRSVQRATLTLEAAGKVVRKPYCLVDYRGELQWQPSTYTYQDAHGHQRHFGQMMTFLPGGQGSGG